MVLVLCGLFLFQFERIKIKKMRNASYYQEACQKLFPNGKIGTISLGDNKDREIICGKSNIIYQESVDGKIIYRNVSVYDD